MLVPRKLEKLLIALPDSAYDAAVARIASLGVFHVEEPPGEVKGKVERGYRLAFAQAQERASRIESYFGLAGVEPRTVKGLELRVGDWVESFKRYLDEFSEVESYYESLSREAAEAENELKELAQVEALLEEFKDVAADVAAAYKLEKFDFVLGYAESPDVLAIVEEEARKGKLVAAVDEKGGGAYLVALAAPRGGLGEVTARLVKAGFIAYTPPRGLPGSPSEAYREVRRRKAELTEKLRRIAEKARERIGDLARYYTVVTAFREVFRLLLNTVSRSGFKVFQGYVDVRDSKKLIKALEEATGGAFTALSLGVVRGEERVPSKVDLPGFLRPFHKLVRLYGDPAPNEIVPTLFMAVTLPVTFALMFPDAGHGLLVLLFALGYLAKRDRDVAFMVSILGLASIVSGLLAAEAFGPIVSKMLGLPKIWEELGLGVPPYALPAFAVEHGEEELIAALMMRAISVSLWVGAFMLVLGSLLGVVNALLARDTEDLVVSKIPRLILFASIGAPFLVYFNAAEAGGVLRRAFLEMGGGDAFATLVLGGVVLSILWSLLAGPLMSLREGHGVLPGLAHSLLEVYESLLMAIGNTSSFLRIMGLALAHSSLTLAFAILAEMLFHAGPVGLVAGWLLYALGNLMVAGLEGLLAFAHSTRLHFYEWFSKFYKGTGLEYRPVKLEGLKLVLQGAASTS